MGIPICARLAKLVGGSLMVADRLDGRSGNAFALRLPCQVCAPRTPVRHAGPHRQPSASRMAVVLEGVRLLLYCVLPT